MYLHLLSEGTEMTRSKARPFSYYSNTQISSAGEKPKEIKVVVLGKYNS
jgi:hypothetical protein